jgi:hypothetical protein
LEGRYLGSSNESLYLLGDQGEIDVPIDKIDELSVRGRATKKAFVIGAVVGAIALGVFLGGFAAFQNSTNGGADSNSAVPLFVFGGAILGGVVFGGIGAGIGAMTSQWHLRYPK